MIKLTLLYARKSSRYWISTLHRRKEYTYYNQYAICGRLRKNIIQMNSLIEAIESMTGTSMPAKYKNNFLEGTNEIMKVIISREILKENK